MRTSSLTGHYGKKTGSDLVKIAQVQGAIAIVTAQTVPVTQLAGAEFFDAVVRIDHVSAVIPWALTDAEVLTVG
jgi:hypothetical protein